MHDRKKYVALFSGALGLGLMHTLFMFYYVKVFLNVFKVNEYWFNIAQVLFMIWNAINDPLFGYLQDLGGTWMKDRSKIFTYFGPFLVFSFWVLWIPWRSSEHTPKFVEGMHLIVGLFLYDAFFSCVGVAWSALYADSTRDHRKRVKALKYSQMAILCSVSVISIAEKASHSLDNFFGFQTVCAVIGCMSMSLFYIAGRLGRSETTEKFDRLLDSGSDKPIDSEGLKWSSVKSLTWELLTAKDFLIIVATNFIHICRSTSHLNFASIATDILIPQNVLAKGSWQISIFFAVCTFVPQILVVTNERLMVTNGAYRLMMFSFISSMLSSVMYFFSYSPYVIMFFIITVHAISPLMNILLSEFIDDDTTRNRRMSPISSIVFSFNALITKPAVSIAPVVVVYLLNKHGYEAYQKEHYRSEDLKWCMLRIIFTIPVVLGSLQFLIFRKYSLRNRHSNPGLPI